MYSHNYVVVLQQGSANFPKMLEPPQTFRNQKGYMKQVT